MTCSNCAPAAGPLAELTPAELDVLHWVAEGQTDKEIAERRSCSAQRVSNHCSMIYMKLGVRNRVEAAVTYHVWCAA